MNAISADEFSYMYSPMEKLVGKATDEGDSFQKPVVLCEYAHAMGNGPGYIPSFFSSLFQLGALLTNI